MEITILHPTRGRPDKSRETIREWIDKSGLNTLSLQVVISLDESDPMLGRYKKIYIDDDRHCYYDVVIGPNKSVVEATNRAALIAKGDILIYVSDDFFPPDYWSALVIKEFDESPCLIKVDDCLQKFHIPVLTIPILNRALYKRLGYFWHPEYLSMWVDCDLYETVKKLGALKMCPHLKFEHKHVSVGKAEDDETYRRSSANWNQGQEVFNRRKKLGFPV